MKTDTPHAHTSHKPTLPPATPRCAPPQMEGRRSWRENWLVFKHYWPRLLVTCGGWVVNDLAFYGVRSKRQALTLPLHLLL